MGTRSMNTSNKHIVFLTPGFAKSENDSTTIPALQVFLKLLKKRLPNAKLTVVTLQYPHIKEPYKWNTINVFPLNGQSKRLKKLLTWRKAISILEKLNNSQKIDALHSFWIGECSRIGEKFAIKHDINHVITVMGQDAIKSNIHAKRLLNSEAKLITLCKNHSNDLKKTYGLDSIIIPWHINITEFPDLKENNIDILGVGSLNTVKNYEGFIEIISSITKIHKNLNVTIIGDGVLRSKLEKKIKNLGLENTITLLGELPRTEVLNKMAQSKILLHTSHYESFGFVFLEALYSGMQVISYDVGLAKTSQQWTVGKNQLELTQACKKTLSPSNRAKKRITLSSELTSINAYTSLYNA